MEVTVMGSWWPTHRVPGYVDVPARPADDENVVVVVVDFDTGL